MLLHQLLFGDRELVAQEEVFEGVPVQDVVHVQRFPVGFEIEPEIARPQPVEFLPPTRKPAERLARVGQIVGAGARLRGD